MKQRVALARVDDLDRQKKIETARSIIYDRDYAVNSEASEALLQEQSLVATEVSF